MPRQEASDELLASIAQLYYQDGLDQRQIATMAGVSRSMVSRLLTAARARGIVRISVAPYQAQDHRLEQRLRQRFSLRRAIVVKTIGRSTESVRRTIGVFAAPVVAEWIKPQSLIGVTGGRTLGEMVDALASSGRVTGPDVVQLMGHIDPTAGKMDAVELGRLLADRLGGSFSGLNVPAFVDAHRTRDLFLAHQHICSVVRRFATLDLALIGVGALEESIFAERSILTTDDFARLREAGAVGEICGRFFDAHGRECPTSYRDRVISIELDQLRRVPEVVAVTNGSARDVALLAALRGGLITSLVIDDLGATALLHTSEVAGTPVVRVSPRRSRSATTPDPDAAADPDAFAPPIMSSSADRAVGRTETLGSRKGGITNTTMREGVAPSSAPRLTTLAARPRNRRA